MSNRRRFLKNSSLAVGGIITGLSIDRVISSSHNSEVIESDTDFDFINRPWDKIGVILEGDQIWEGEYIQNYNSNAEPLPDGKWRIWYGVNPPAPGHPNIAFAEGTLDNQWEKHVAILSESDPVDAPLSIGNLPKNWMPVQPVHIKLKSGVHRLYFWAHSPEDGVVRYLVAESDDNRKYRVLDPYRPCLYHHHDRAVDYVGVTTSGMKLQAKSDDIKRKFPRPDFEPEADPTLICNDATTVYQLNDGSFEMYTIALQTIDESDKRWAPNDNLVGYARVVDRLVSSDGLNWGGRQTVLEMDMVKDPIDLQFYYLNVTYTKKGRIGMLGCYRTRDQTMDLELCFSSDGIAWERPNRQMAWIERGWPPEDADTLGIYPATSLVYHEGNWWLFYTGCNYTHNMKISTGKPRSVIMAAKCENFINS